MNSTAGRRIGRAIGGVLENLDGRALESCRSKACVFGRLRTGLYELLTNRRYASLAIAVICIFSSTRRHLIELPHRCMCGFLVALASILSGTDFVGTQVVKGPLPKLMLGELCRSVPAFKT